MKKIISVIFIVLAACTTFFYKINLSLDSKKDDLAGSIAANIAHADSGDMEGCFYTSYWLDECAQFPFYAKYCKPSYMFLRGMNS